MKKTLVLIALGISVVFIIGCPIQNPLGLTNQDGELGTEGSFSLPADSIDDTVRSLSGEFGFETLLPVNVSIKVNLYDPNALTDGASPLLPSGTVPVLVLIENGEGESIYSGVTGDDGVFEAVINLPAASEDLTLKLVADGFEDRVIGINDMVEYSRISRTMGMEMPFTSTPGQQSRSVTGSKDSDGDGVPDEYDAAPNNAIVAFTNSIPALGPMTIAFEDLFGRAQAGDADYNDFIAQYQITEDTNSDGVTAIRVDADAKEKLAGYWHRFGVRINSFDGTATLEGEYIDSDGNPAPFYVEKVSAPIEIDLFKDSRTALYKHAWFTLAFDQEQQRGDEIENALDDAPYNPYLFVGTTGHDIHLIDEQPLDGSINPNDKFRDSEGFPWALLVPVDWAYPKETERIEIPYPRFTLWRESFGIDHTDWYDIDDNDPPEATIIASGIEVAGAGEPEVDGIYDETGTFNGKPFYEQVVGDANKIFWSSLTAPVENFFWCIHTDETEPDGSEMEYISFSSADTPPLVPMAWTAMLGVPPVPSLALFNIFTGSPTVGETLTVQYVFSDPDPGDTEGTTRFRWFRRTPPSDTWVEISSAASQSYSIQSEDAGSYLRVEIIPVDSRDGEGTPVLGETSELIGS